MASKPEAEAMQELASMLWSRFLKERVREELNHELNAYKAEVVSNNGNGTLTVRRPFESVTPTLKAAPSLAYAQPGDMVMVAGIGDKSKALSNAFVLAKADLSDDTSVPVYGQGENLLDNWYFIGGGSQQGGEQFPINQRWKTSYSNGYGIDRWIVRNANMTMAVEANGLKLSYSSGSYADFYQLIGPERLANLAGKTVTFSILDNNGIHAKTFVWDASGSGSDKGYLANDLRLYAGGTTSSYINLVLRAYINNYSLMAVKLELGDKQTLAHKENGTWVLNTVPSYEEELIRCITSTADSADTYANKTLATEQQIAYVENGLTASRAYAYGEYFCWNGFLCRATAAISSGQAFTVGTNCVQRTVSEVMKGLYSILVMAGTHSITLSPGLHLLLVKTHGNAAAYGVYVVTYSVGTGESSVVPISEGASHPTVSISGNTLSVSTYTTGEISYINFTQFRI